MSSAGLLMFYEEEVGGIRLKMHMVLILTILFITLAVLGYMYSAAP